MSGTVQRVMQSKAGGDIPNSQKLNMGALDEEMNAIKKLKAQAAKSPIPKMSADIRTHMQVISKIYDDRDVKTQLKIKKMRNLIQQGKSVKEKTFAEENMEQLEEKVTEQFRQEMIADNNTTVIDLRNKGALFDESLANKEKLSGHFSLKLNKNANRLQNIGKFANDNVVFYLHKRRNFVEKIHNQKKDERKEKQILKQRNKILKEYLNDKSLSPKKKTPFPIKITQENIDLDQDILSPTNMERFDQYTDEIMSNQFQRAQTRQDHLTDSTSIPDRLHILSPTNYQPPTPNSQFKQKSRSFGKHMTPMPSTHEGTNNPEASVELTFDRGTPQNIIFEEENEMYKTKSQQGFRGAGQQLSMLQNKIMSPQNYLKAPLNRKPSYLDALIHNNGGGGSPQGIIKNERNYENLRISHDSSAQNSYNLKNKRIKSPYRSPQSKQTYSEIPLPIVQKDHRGYPSLKNQNMRKGLEMYDQIRSSNSQLFHFGGEDQSMFNENNMDIQNEQLGRVIRNKQIQQDFYRMNLIQNRIQAIGNDSDTKKINKATIKYFPKRNQSVSYNSGYQSPRDIINSARADVQEEIDIIKGSVMNKNYNIRNDKMMKYSKTPNLQDRYVTNFKRPMVSAKRKKSILNSRDGSPMSQVSNQISTPFLPAIQGIETPVSRKIMNKAHFMNINENHSQTRSPSPSAASDKSSEIGDEGFQFNKLKLNKFNQPFITNVKSIIIKCLQSSEEGKKSMSGRKKSIPVSKKIEQAFHEIDIKKTDLETVLEVMDSLEGCDSLTFEQMFMYKMMERDEQNKEKRRVTKEYYMDSIDPNKKVMLKKKKAEIKPKKVDKY